MSRPPLSSPRSASALLGTLLLSLLAACGGTQPSDQQDRSSAASDQPQTTEATASEETALTRAAELNTASLEAAEQRAQATDAKAGAASADLDSLAPGQPAPKSAYTSGAVARKAQSLGIVAYRFYNTRSGAHFYTVSQAERDNVRNNLSPPYSYEGEAFRVASLYAPGLSPVHRFFNTRNGVHFYTISEAERAYVAANLKHYTYEGVAYHASEVAGANLIPFHRFYVPSQGFHFYTASEAEKNHIIANLGATYRYEGVGYYVLHAQWNAEKLPGTGIPAGACYMAGSDTPQDCTSAGTSALNPLQDSFFSTLGYGRLEYRTVSRTEEETFPLDECVLDKVTGLVWEGKRQAEPRGGNALFTNLGNGAATDVSGHVAAINASRLCGFSDWRLPSRMELQSIVHYGQPPGSKAIDLSFVNAYPGQHWTSDTDASDANQAWALDFAISGGNSFKAPRNQTKAVSLVRGTPLGGGATRFSYTTIAYPGDAANNVVNDAWTGLQWRRCEEGRAWNGTACSSPATMLTTSHEAALAHAKQQRGWRMPNIKELASLTDLGVRAGSTLIDPVAFPGAASAFLWATTPYLYITGYAWEVQFGTGEVGYFARSGAFGVRLVRANYSFVN